MSLLTELPTISDELRRLRPMSDAAVEGIAVLSADGVILEGNASLGALAGRDARALSGVSLGDLIGGAGLAALRDLSAAGGGEAGIEVEIHRPDGFSVPAEMRLRSIDLVGRRHALVSLADLRPRRAAEERIGRRAQRDPLTGLRNRAGLDHALHAETSRAERHGGSFAVLCLDLDGFKAINDAHGHAAGDEALRIVARRLTEVTRETDVTFRLGGDEFLILQSYAADANHSARLCERLIAAVGRPFLIGDALLFLGISIGIAHFPDHGRAIDELLRNADAALYKAKHEGKNTHRFFDPSLNAALERRRSIETELMRAVDRSEFDLVYEPEMEAATGAVLGFEVSLRWSSAKLGPVDPAEFMPIAQEAGLMTALSEWVIHEACREAASWARPLGISIQAPLRLFQSGDVAQTFLQALKASGLAPARLRIDVTEATSAHGADGVPASLSALKARGARLGLYAFGAGSASIGALRGRRFDTVKLDRSCIAPDDESRLSLKAVVAACDVFGARVAACGVASTDARAALAAIGCHLIQGEIVSPPRSISAFAPFTGAASVKAGQSAKGTLGPLRERLAQIDPWSIRVLVVDDSELMAETLSAMLAAFGFTRVDCATDGAKAMERLRRGAYGLVISDWNMAPVSGIELLGRIRADPALRGVKFLMLTANARAANRLAARDAGVDGFLVKPFRADSLATKIRDVFAAGATASLAG